MGRHTRERPSVVCSPIRTVHVAACRRPLSGDAATPIFLEPFFEREGSILTTDRFLPSARHAVWAETNV
jgi:hypothetical protein